MTAWPGLFTKVSFVDKKGERDLGSLESMCFLLAAFQRYSHQTLGVRAEARQIVHESFGLRETHDRLLCGIGHLGVGARSSV
jgi:hypothetical protein